ncbi:hypothetical protein SKAU_G00174240 [Synaphobranchus kaupii]|uniref:Lck-interacting transmembrane adapter 1 n=1 Tax=Synaphobranchus kaupii TaxID=118154 RepID=A0A9Q1IYW4_SYNKA|nr:hypothetical protein SKAU_G00174240 [Synaphobranchus kaupii]
MASMQDGLNLSTPPYGKVLVLGAIAAASAFVVTILIVLLCVGCQRKGKSHNSPSEGTKHRLMDMSILRQSKLRSISKSDTKLHEMNRLNCNGKKASKNRPASMDLLLLPSRRSNSDLRGQQTRQLPQIPTTGERDHTYSEVGAPSRCHDDSLYEMDPVTAEYACIRKVRKVDKIPRAGPEQAESDPLNVPPQPHPLSQKVPRKHVEPFHLHSFPKEAVFMGNGEQYIWKPPEDDDMALFPPKHMGPQEVEAGTQTQVSDMYSKVCKPCKKKRAVPGSPPAARENNGHRTLARGCGGGAEREGGGGAGFSVVVKPQSWSAGAQHEGDPCYESIPGEKAWPPVEPSSSQEAEMVGWKREWPPPLPNTAATLRPRKKKEKPPPPPQPKALPNKALAPENLYESIGDLKHGVASSSTTTIFTFNDGMEMTDGTGLVCPRPQQRRPASGPRWAQKVDALTDKQEGMF